MKKIFCDACGQNVEDVGNNANNVLIPIHIVDILNGKVVGYVDSHNNPISGRNIQLEICTPCFNKVMLSMAKTIKEINKENDMNFNGTTLYQASEFKS